MTRTRALGFFGWLKQQRGTSTLEFAVVLPLAADAGKDAHVRVQRVGQPGVTETRSWGAHERVSVKRAGRAEEDKR
jgi:hypothetical protein